MMRASLIVLLALATLAATAGSASAAPEKVAGGIRFTYTDPNAGTLGWAGEFNGWNGTATPMAKDAKGVWSVVIALPAGEHQYKFVVDGQWVADPENGATAGDMGNSVVRVGADGNLGAAAATANSPYNAKILIGGRIIGLFQDIHNPTTRRFEMSRPSMDTDLSFDVRVSDVLKAHVLTNINSEKQSTQDYRTSLSFDRGTLEYAKGRLQLMGWDNVAIETWDDPLHLVGAVGIYQHPYGYDRQGFKVASQYYGCDAEMLYADNFQTGGTTYPSFTTQELAAYQTATVESLLVRPGGSGYALIPGQLEGAFRTDPSDGNADMFALRIGRDLGHGLRARVLGRSQRGQDLGVTVFTRATGPLSYRQYSGTFDQSWYAYGAELGWDGPDGFRGYGEWLHGRKRLSFVSGYTNTRTDVTLAGLDTTGAAAATIASSSTMDVSGDGLDLDRSDRWLLGGTWTEAHGDILVRLEVEGQTHDYELYPDGISNSMTVTRFQWDRNWRYYLNREVKTSLDLEYTAFDYDANTPWSHQFWFPDGNFWLERTEHVVSVDRMLMLGGNDALRVKPMLEVPVLAARNGLVRWKGTFETAAPGRRPKYAENRLQLGCDVNRMLRLTTDSRWVKYDDPFFALHSGYLCHFAEATWTFAPGASLALGFGVDPYVIDETLNEYADIGRDVFLFARGANGATAEDNYYGLGAKIAAAEKALENERVVQIKAIVRF
jgi:hypothetical protein